jgi:hypothetical protein
MNIDQKYIDMISKKIISELKSESPSVYYEAPSAPTNNPGNWTMIKEAVPLTTIFSADWNNEFQNVINNSNPDGLAGASQSIADMRSSKVPYIDDLPQLVTSLRGELEGLRYQISAITGELYWYIPPSENLIALKVTGSDLHNHLGIDVDPEHGGGAPIGTDAILDDAITEDKINNDAVTTDKIKDGNVTRAKLTDDLRPVVMQYKLAQNNNQSVRHNYQTLDDIIPVSPFGTIILTLSITPKFDNSMLSISGSVSVKGQHGFIIALFRSGSTAAIYTNYVDLIAPYTTASAVSIPILFDQPSGTTEEEITYTVEVASTSNVDYNVNPYFLTTVYSSLRIMEILE